ncbi:hypothetical protein [Roseinatronobacter thiooxidans]|uniref:hypothetical protein n=1 Tax=Roseinatronobacter thiooxidans TaxID=121821 RepID=UPI0008F92CE1|nr:hypothetical protein [Roseinatronobacter thiooxidans]
MVSLAQIMKNVVAIFHEFRAKLRRFFDDFWKLRRKCAPRLPHCSEIRFAGAERRLRAVAQQYIPRPEIFDIS